MKKWIGIIVCVCTLGMTAQAVPILLGTVNPGSPANVPAEVTYVNGLIDAVEGTYTGGTPGTAGTYTIGSRTFTPLTSAAAGTYADVSILDTDGEGDWTTAITVSGWDYALGKYGNTSVIWFVGGEEFTIPKNVSILQQSLSHYQVFTRTVTKVPDSGSTLVLIGLAVTGLGFVRRKMA